MEPLTILLGAALILLVLWEGFESIIMPRRVTRRFRLTRVFFRSSWGLWARFSTRLFSKRASESLLSVYGPLSFLMLMLLWATGLVTGFALIHWGTGSPFKTPEPVPTFLSDLYFSATTFFTLGLGDITPTSQLARFLTVAEGGMGFGFLALIISYLPLLNQSFERREINISMLDSRAGSPPTASEMLIRHSHDQAMDALTQLLHDWERWSAEFLEGHLSYPVLAYFRSQHDNQSWLGALTAILDTCALVMVVLEGTCVRQAELTFAMARHAVVDLSLVFQRAPRTGRKDRLSAEEFTAMTAALKEAGLKLKNGGETEEHLRELRQLYEPYLKGLSVYFRVTLPPWYIAEKVPDNWQVSGWDKSHQHRHHEPAPQENTHF
ncbi:potassium channel family protein [Geomesophilobacter sediminis]|uniref:Two pore domain potassium channel family protein n=1 Tax=Geomesophilobacter sediminis TaxID=2798584 RepID=A0A8J7J0F8_9BACT|nr:potassium channel family protein [Geomesophilobacter sediminis]MBJ6723853.1 two pore domain potassium channel family protein [Geomesophilobacter sediminis]